MSIAADQKAFVRIKVEELGSFKAVEALYNTDSPVDKFAIRVAKRLYQSKEVENANEN